jgi:hypothetical protein
MRVFRVENADGAGVYSCCIVDHARDRFRIGDEYEWTEPNPYRHPCPDADVPDWSWTMKDYFCCFDSLAMLVRWFDSEKIRAAMAELGALVVEYEIDDSLVLRGTWQCMFLRERSVRIGTVPMPLAVPAAA